MEYQTKENAGRITLRMYIRGASKTDKQFLVDTFNKRRDAINATLAQKLQECTNSSSPCSDLASYTELQKKIQDLTEGTENNKNESVEGIYFISQQIQSLKEIEEQLSLK